MTDLTHPDTIDWTDFWRTADESEREAAMPSTAHAVTLLPAFAEEKGVPDSLADVGCGPGPVAFDLAERYPELTVVGYDAAESVLRENRERSRREDVANVRFERTVLPDFDPDRSFDLVFCFGTLCYVAETAAALRALYGAVAPGGHLVLSYFTDLGRAHYGRLLEADDPDVGPGFDSDRFAERFELMLSGESTLSYRQIHDAIGTWPRSFWEVTEKPEAPWAWRHVPLVWIPK